MCALKGGLVSRITIHAIDVTGNLCVVAVNGEGDTRYWLWTMGMDEPVVRQATTFVINGNVKAPPAAGRYAKS
jgi:L-asparaginase